MDCLSVTTLREEPCAIDEQEDTGFNSKQFAFMAREGEVCATAVGAHRPRMVVRCIARHRGRVLLCQRADEPRRGLWNTPGGFLEHGETLRTAAIRETLEESGVTVHTLKLGFIYKFPQLNEIVAMYVADVRDASIAPGRESHDARFFEIESLPWGQLAFPTDSDALRRTFQHTPYRRRSLPIVECFWEADGRIFARQR
jgi:ADP-ribose pyrophosphatase YjhB (NUDIX family)